MTVRVALELGSHCSNLDEDDGENPLNIWQECAACGAVLTSHEYVMQDASLNLEQQGIDDALALIRHWRTHHAAELAVIEERRGERFEDG